MIPKVLLVDDDADWLRICSKRLPQTHYTLKMSTSIVSASRLLSAETFAVVVADICMPGARGLGGLEILSKTKSFRPETRRVMITAYAGGLKDITDEALTKKLANNFVEKKKGLQELDNCIMYEVDCWKQRCEIRKFLEEEREPIVDEHEAKGDLEPPETPIWTAKMQKESWKRQLVHHRRNLAILEEQVAQYGLAVPLEIVNAMEKEKRDISELESKLRGLEGDKF
jgi:CheY-like chemotaxis protein